MTPDVSLTIFLDENKSQANSRAAFEHLRSTGQLDSLKEIVYELLLQHDEGMTYDELWTAVNLIRPGTKEGTVRPRIVELRKEGRVESGSVMRKDTPSGIPHLIWKATKTIGV